MHPFDDPSPSFLTSMDSEPQRTFAEFYRFAVGLLTVHPPGPMRAVPLQDRLDLIHDLVLHCCDSDFRVLRSFDSSRSRFAVWFGCVARNFAVDRLRARSNPSAHASAVDPELELERLPSNPSDPQQRIWADEVLAAVAVAMGRLGEICQVLLRGAAQGMRPHEPALLLRWPADWNKKASDDLRACRSRLRRELTAAGLSVDDL